MDDDLMSLESTISLDLEELIVRIKSIQVVSFLNNSILMAKKKKITAFFLQTNLYYIYASLIFQLDPYIKKLKIHHCLYCLLFIVYIVWWSITSTGWFWLYGDDCQHVQVLL